MMAKNLKTFSIMTLLVTAGCLPFNEQKKSDCSSTQTYSATLRRCLSNDEVAGITGSNHLPQAYGNESVTTDSSGGSFDEGEFTTFNVQPGSDTDDDSLTYVVTADPSYGTLTNCMNKTGSSGGTDLSCTYTPDINHAGSDSFSYKVHDGKAYSASAATITFTITGTDDTPTVSSPSDATVDEDTVINVYYDVDEGGGVDENSQSTTFTVDLDAGSNLATYLNNDGSIKIYWGSTLLKTCTAPGATDCSTSLGDSVSGADASQVRVMITLDTDENGSATSNNVTADVDVIVSDGVTTATDEVIYTISAVDDNPTLTAISDPAAVNEDVALAAITLTVDEGGHDAGAYTDEDSTNASVTITSSNTSLVSLAGTKVTLTCDGGGATVAGNATVGSDGVWDLNADLGGNCVTASDLGAAGVTLNITPEAGQYGTSVITVTLTDAGGNTASDTFTVTVNEVNDDPELKLDPAGVVEGTSIFTQHGANPNGDGTSISCVAGDYAGPTASTCQFAQDETIDLDFIVDEDSITTDGTSEEDDQSLKIKITSSDTTVVDYDDVVVYYAGTSKGSPTDNTTEISLGDGSTDASTSTPLSGSNTGLTLKVSPSGSGTATITITLLDYNSSGTALGTSTQHQVTLTVDDVNMDPEIDPIADIEGNEGLPINNVALTGISEGTGDLDDDELTMSFSVVLTTDAEYTSDCGLTTTQKSNYNTALVPVGNIDIFEYGGTVTAPTVLADGILDDYLGADYSPSDAGKEYYLSVDPVNGQNGSVCIKVTLTDDNDEGATNGAQSTTDLFIVTINAVSVAFNGWEEIMSVGDKVDIYDNVLDEGYIYLEWEPYTISGSTITGYNVYCTRDAGLNYYDFSQPLNATTIASSVYEFDSRTTTMDTSHPCLNSDDDFDDGFVYYFLVAAVDASGKIVGPTDTMADLRVIFPPANMSLVHRYMANQEMCDLMELTKDPSNGNRCAHNGLGAIQITGTYYYDFYLGGEYDLLVDTYEAGCPYTKPQSAHCDYQGNGCIGDVVPTNVGVTGAVDGDIYYNRADGQCYRRNGGVWYALSTDPDGASPIVNYDITTTAGTSGDVENDWYSPASSGRSLYRSAHLPPLTNINPAQANTFCNGVATFTLDEGTSATAGAAIQPRLPQRKEFIAAAAWDPDLDDDTINDIESGGSLDVNHYCNGQTSNGVTYVSASVPTSSFWDGLPSTSGWGKELVVTGSTATEDCISRYGIQDLVGNVSEYSLERFDCTAGGADCDTTTDHAGSNAWDNYNGGDYDLGAGAEGPDSTANALTYWDFDDETYSSTEFYPALGLPAVAAAPYTLDIGPATSGITGDQLHGDRITINETSLDAVDDVATFANGGNFASGSDNAGRWTLDFVGHTKDTAPSNGERYGFRCVAKVPVSY